MGVYNALYSDIADGAYRENETLPGENVLAERYGVSRNTLRQALAILSEDGLIVRAQGKGTLVAPKKDSEPAARPGNPMTGLAREAVSEVRIQYNYGPPTDIARARLGIGRSELVLAADSVYLAGAGVLGYSFTQVPAAMLSALGVDIGLEGEVEKLVTSAIFEQAETWDATFKMVQANEMEAAFLGAQEGRPLQLIEALLYGPGGQSLARCKFYFIPEHYQLRFQF